MRIFILLCLFCFSCSLARDVIHPFVVLPPFLRTGTTNTIIVTPIKSSTENVDISLSVSAIQGTNRTPLYTQKFKAKKAGSTHQFHFDLNTNAELAEVIIEVSKHIAFNSEIRIRPNVGAIHIHTSKNIYRAGETVEARVLPLNNAGNIFTGPIDIALVNPDGYELTRHRVTASDTFVSLHFDLPLHLFFGDWRILARPAGFRDSDMTYETVFIVRDYDLPPFQIRLTITDDDPLEANSIVVEANYFHGAPVDGTLIFYCTPYAKNQTSSRTIRLLQSEISSGLWLGSADLRQCFDSSKLPASILVEARDRGTGGRGEAKVEFDPLKSGFDMIPMRPAFDDKTKEMLLITAAMGAPSNSELQFQFSCLSSERLSQKEMVTRVGTVITFEIPNSWSNCPVIMIQANRATNSDKSRTRTIMIPSVTPEIDGKSVVAASWITVTQPKVFYSVGEQFEVLVPSAESNKLNYMVLCNSHTVVYSGRVRDDGQISINLNSKFLGKCILFVYSTNQAPLADMVQFYVKDNCSASIFSSQNEMKPGQNITFTLNGEPYGLAILRATDDRLMYIQSKAEAQKSRSWDFGMFDRADATNSRNFQAKLANFVKVKELRIIIEKKCQRAAASYKNKFGKCPEARISSSCISNHCIKWMVEACHNPPAPTTSSVCDERNRAGCRQEIIMASRFGVFEIRGKGLPNQGLQSALSDVPNLPDDNGSDIRENFEEVWIFDSFNLGASGTSSINTKSPDNIGKWAVTSVFWSPGQQELCPAPGISVLSKKKVFMQVDIPRNVYVNETVTVKISVSQPDANAEYKYSICMSELSRKVCGDLGSLGQHGRPTYTRVVVNRNQKTDTKTFTIRFLSTGASSVLFRLRKEESFPGKHHCDVGEVLDSVRLKLFIAKRAETEEHSKQIILNAEKPLAIALNDALGRDNHVQAKHNILEVSEYRSVIEPGAIVTHVTANIHDTDTVYSFSVDLSKFLITEIPYSNLRRSKRGALEFGNSFLSDVLKQLSVEFYQFRKAKMQDNADLRSLEYSENKIGTLISDLLRFSDCSNETSCGFAEYGRPRDESERSPLLTSITTSLLCESSADERLVCGAMSFLHQFLIGKRGLPVDLHDMIDIETETDKQWFLNALLLQVSKDCAAYQCTKNDAAWMNLYTDFYNLDENYRFDDRTIAALAYMGSNATTEIMRTKMRETMDKNILPFWTAGNALQRIKSKMSSFDRQNQYRRIKSGDLLVNALGVLSFITTGADGRDIDWDPLANWIFEQQTDDGTYETALDTYFASRALFEYRSRKVDFASNSYLQVTVECSGCERRTINVTESASEIYLPISTRNFTLTTKGRGKVKAGVRVLLTKRQRSRRGLTMDDYYPVRIHVDQQSVAAGIIKQMVCLTIMSPMLKTIEITHGFFTGYSSKAANIEVLANSTHMKIYSLPTISSYAAHFVLEGLQHRTTQCYEVGVVEPQHNHEPIHLAPVAIVARHPINDVVGLVLISHPDQIRMKRSSSPTVPFIVESNKNHERSRKPRNIIDESIDTVCFSGGTCTCAETTCGVRCGMCKNDKADELRRRFLRQNAFGAQLRVIKTERVLVDFSYYNQIETEVREKKGAGEGYVAEKLTVWIRDCNHRCLPAEGIKKGDRYYMQGDTEALVIDADGRQHYVLRDMDRWEKSSSECKEWAVAVNLE